MDTLDTALNHHNTVFSKAVLGTQRTNAGHTTARDLEPAEVDASSYDARKEADMYIGGLLAVILIILLLIILL